MEQYKPKIDKTESELTEKDKLINNISHNLKVMQSVLRSLDLRRLETDTEANLAKINSDVEKAKEALKEAGSHF